MVKQTQTIGRQFTDLTALKMCSNKLLDIIIEN